MSQTNKFYQDIISKIKSNMMKRGIDPDIVQIAFGQANKEDLKVLTNLYETFAFSSEFYNEDELEFLKNIKVPNRIIEFYREFEPQNVPVLKGGIRLLSLSGILEENSRLAPGIYLLKYGVLTFTTTIGGNAICMDFNTEDKQPRIILVDHEAFYYNEILNIVEWATIPDHLADDEELLELSHKVIKNYLPEVCSTFEEFLLKVANEEFEDIEEEYLYIF